MTPEEITSIMRETLLVTLEIAAPFLLLVLVIGFLIALLQSVTRIHEMTLSFVPKMLIVAVAIAVFFPWIMKIMTKFTHTILIEGWGKVTGAL
jgi:flagellar biosynthetic protein FliQ